MKGSVKMINLVNADKILKQLYLSMVTEELEKIKKKEEKENKPLEEKNNE